MKKRLLCLCFALCAAILFVSAAVAADSPIRITERTFEDGARSFTVNLPPTELRGSLFVAVYAQNGQMKDVEEYPAQAATPVTLRNVSDADSVKAIWLDEAYMPLAQTEVFKTVEIDAKTQDEFASAVLSMMRLHDADAMGQSSDEYAFGRLIVRSDEALPDLSAYRVAQRVSDAEGHTVLQFDSPADARACAEYLESRVSSGGYVEPDTLESLPDEAGMESGAESAHLSWGVPVIRADSYAANLFKRGVNRPITVAVVDTGVNYNHPFLKGRTVAGYDFADGDRDPMDEHRHGTHVAGIIVDCALELTNLKIMPVRVLGASGSGTSLNVGLGVRYAADNGASVINMSLGGPDNAYKDEAIDYAISKNITVVVAAGNDSRDAKDHCPAHIRKCVTVAATDKNWKPAGFSNYGDAVDLAAPGVDIKSCVLNDGYQELSGTSMASPHVAACAAMLLEESPSLTPAQVESKLVESAQVPSGWNAKYGAGVVNMETPKPAGFYALLYTDGELAFQRSPDPAPNKTLADDEENPYPISEASYDDGGGDGQYAGWHKRRAEIKRVTFVDKVSPASTALWFYGCKNLTSVQNIGNLDAKNVRDMSQMFSGCSALTTLDLRGLDTGSVTNMSQMFFQCKALTTIYASDTFSVSKVTNGENMFTGCEALVGGAGTKLGPTDQSYARIDQAPSRPGYFTDEKANVFYAIFYKVDGELVFQNSAAPDSARGESEVFSVNAAVDGSYVKWYAYRDQIQTVTFAEEVHPLSTAVWFYNFEVLKTVNNVKNLKTDKVTDMSQMFSRCSGLETLDLRGLDTGSVTNARQMFFQCKALKTILVSDAFNVSKMEESDDMFADCLALTGEQGTAYNAKYADKTYARIDQGPSGPGYFSSGNSTPTPNPSRTLCAVLYDNGELKFQSDAAPESGRTAVKSYTTDSGGYDGEAYVAWYGEREQIRSVSFGASIYPTSTALWFYGCANLASFNNFVNLHTDCVTDMSQMFSYCSSLSSLDLSGFHTEKVTDMSLMFYRCAALRTIYASGAFTTGNVVDSDWMFDDCVALQGGAGTSYSSAHTNKTYARIDSSSAAGYFTAK